MKKYWIDFSGFVCVEAANREEAERRMCLQMCEMMERAEDFQDSYWDIDGIEEREDAADLLKTVYGDSL